MRLTNIVVASALSIPVLALEPIEDQGLSDIVGQSLIQLDRYHLTHSEVDTTYTRLTLKAELETLINIDRFELGRYERTEETAASDIGIRHLTLGEVLNDGSLNPFYLKKPYIEYATQALNGQTTLVGVRVSLGESKGLISFDIDQLTGRLSMELANWYNGDKWASGWTGLTTRKGLHDAIRARHFGVPTGDTVEMLGMSVVSRGCRSLWLTTCFSLNRLKAVNVDTANAGENGLRDSVFVGFQAFDGLVWGNPEWQETQVETLRGAFANLPAGPMSFTDAQKGIPRARAEYRERGLGRWSF